MHEDQTGTQHETKNDPDFVYENMSVCVFGITCLRMHVRMSAKEEETDQ